METIIVGIIALLLFIYLLRGHDPAGEILSTPPCTHLTGFNSPSSSALLALITKPMGLYLMQVLDANGRTWLDPVLKPLERLTYRSWA